MDELFLLTPIPMHDNIGQSLDNYSEEASNDDPDLESTKLNELISIEEVESACRVNSDHKSSGVNGIRPAYLKIPSCIKFIHALCNHFFKTGTVPSSWLEAFIKPIPKASKNSTLLPEHRGIALQSFVAKTYCRILDYLELNSILNDEQNGFRPDRCRQDHIFTLTSIIENRLLTKQDTFACFIDFQTALTGGCFGRSLRYVSKSPAISLNLYTLMLAVQLTLIVSSQTGLV